MCGQVRISAPLRSRCVCGFRPSQERKSPQRHRGHRSARSGFARYTTVMKAAIIGFPAPDESSRPVLFTDPIRTYSAQSVAEVMPLMRAIDEEANSGFWVVLMLSYE